MDATVLFGICGFLIYLAFYVVTKTNTVYITKTAYCPYPVYINDTKIQQVSKQQEYYDHQKPLKKTSQENIDLVINGLVKIGMKKVKAASLVSKMCKDRYYDDAQDLFEACFPHINS